MSRPPPAWTCLTRACKVGVPPALADCSRAGSISPKRAVSIRRTRRPASSCCAVPLPARPCVFSRTRRTRCGPSGERTGCRPRAGDPMMTGWGYAHNLLSAPLIPDGLPCPFVLPALLCDLRRRFLPKGRAGRGHRAIARNGRVLLCSDLPCDRLEGRPALVRLQPWHKAILPGESAAPYGVLLYVRTLGEPAGPFWTTTLVKANEAGGDLRLDLGGTMALAFFAPPV